MPDITPVESEGRGVPVWVPIGLVLVVVVLLSVPALYLIRSALEAEWTFFDSDETVMPADGVSEEGVPVETYNLSEAGMSMDFPSDWVVFPLFDAQVRDESFERAADEFGPDAETYLRREVEWVQSVSGTRVLVAWDVDDRVWVTVGRWPRGINDYPDYVLNDLTETAEAIVGDVEEFDREFSVAGAPGVHGFLTAAWADLPGNYEQHWYVLWADEATFRLIFTFDENSERDRATVIEMMESLTFN